MQLNYNQESIDLSDKIKRITFRKGSGKTKVIDEAKIEDRKHKVKKCRKKEGKVKSNAPKSDKEKEKWLKVEIRSDKKEEECESKIIINRGSLIFH